MNIRICARVTLMATAILAGCAGGSSASAPTQPAPAAVTGVDTPKSVSVVTAN